MGQDCQLGQETHGRSRPTSPSLRERPLCAFQKAEKWANMQSVPANYLALLLLPGRPGLLDGPMFCVSNVRWPGFTSQRSWVLVDPSGSHLTHRTQTSAGVLVGLWQTLEWRGIEKGGKGGGELREGKWRAAFLGEFIRYGVTGREGLRPAPPPKEGKGKREAFSWGFLGKPGVQSVDASPPLLCFPQLFLFSPVGYYFLTHFDNYFINQER